MSEAEESLMGATGCELFLAELQGYLEGELKPGLESHARTCPSCGAVLADVTLIRSAAGSLELEEPPARLWSNIRATLVEEGIIHSPQTFWQRWLSRPHPMLSPVAAVAAAVLVVFAATLVKESRHRFPTAPLPAESAAVESPVAGELEEMEGSFRAQAGSLDPSLRAGYEKGLQSLDGEISDLSASVKRNPSDTLAQDYLNTAYVQKARVLESALKLGDR